MARSPTVSARHPHDAYGGHLLQQGTPAFPGGGGYQWQEPLQTGCRGHTLWGDLQVHWVSLALDILVRMDRHELRAIVGFLSGVRQGLHNDDDKVLTLTTVTELAEIIDRLMNAAFDAVALKQKVRLARLERQARQHKREIETRLDTRP